jgi:flagellar hook assembly protein FlgD
VNGEFGTLQKIFSPDNDGFEDVLQFFYTMPQPGMIATLRIFDDQGRTIRKLLQSELLGIEGNITWDGVNDDSSKSAPGIYLAVIEAFSIDGSANYSQRIAFTLAGKLD